MFGLKRPCPPAPCAAKSHARVYGAIVIGENKRSVGESKRKQDKSGKKVGSRKGVGVLLPTIRPATGLPLTGVPTGPPGLRHGSCSCEFSRGPFVSTYCLSHRLVYLLSQPSLITKDLLRIY